MEKLQDKIAVDVVLLPPEEIMDKAIEVNQALIKTVDNKIVLNKQNCFPHLSLAMGSINKDDIPEIDTVLKDIAEKFSPMKLTISNIRAETIPTGEKVSGFEIVKTKDLQLLHETVMNKLSPYFTYDVSLDMIYALPNQQVEEVTAYWIENYPKDSSFENFFPHITIGFGEEEGETSGLKFPTKSNAPKLALCHLGNYCTCRKILSSHDLKMKNKSPLVNIGMPVYNGGRFLSEALDSLLNQDFQNFELIISDNASTDNTAEICKRYLEKDNRIKYYRNEVNIGAEANFNKLINYATAPYFMWASHDDIRESPYITELVKIMESDKSIVLAFSDFDNIDENGKQIRIYPKILKLSPSETIFKRAYRFILFKEADGKANLIYGLMRTPIIKEIGGFVNFGRGDYAIDDLTLFLIVFKGDFHITNKLLFHKRLVSSVDKQLNEYTFRECFIKTPRFIHNICEHLIEIHGYFFGYRRIIGTSKLPLYQKIILHFLTILREVKWYIRTTLVVLKGFIYHAVHIMLYKLAKLIAD